MNVGPWDVLLLKTGLEEAAKDVKGVDGICVGNVMLLYAEGSSDVF
jgi:hypothetical protein